ncbi:hypothetical protein SO802_012815 [Lithocarpus litseifolius]|uniref:RNase H type-1 domain-containing protein n=1 Tax=Lithocarpus litseifolius TaxID=425828 RepID=A0AAW2D584_9ROSI
MESRIHLIRPRPSPKLRNVQGSQGFGLAALREKVVRIRWEKPQAGWARLNNDGAALGNPGRAGTIVQLLSNPSNANLCAMPLIDDYRLLILQIAQVRIDHCYHEANRCANFLARLGTKQDRTFVLYNDLPVDLWELLSSDRDGMYHNRTIIEHSPPL